MGVEWRRSVICAGGGWRCAEEWWRWWRRGEEAEEAVGLEELDEDEDEVVERVDGDLGRGWGWWRLCEEEMGGVPSWEREKGWWLVGWLERRVSGDQGGSWVDHCRGGRVGGAQGGMGIKFGVRKRGRG